MKNHRHVTRIIEPKLPGISGILPRIPKIPSDPGPDLPELFKSLVRIFIVFNGK